jgi:hypothetical protein
MAGDLNANESCFSSKPGHFLKGMILLASQHRPTAFDFTPNFVASNPLEFGG